MEVIEKVEKHLAESKKLSRGSFVSRLTKGSIVLTAGAAGLLFPSSGLAHGCRHVMCCHLAFCPDCTDCSCSGSCSAGAWSWTCQGSTGCWWMCVECYACECSCAVALCSEGCPCFGEGRLITESKYVSIGDPRMRSGASGQSAT